MDMHLVDELSGFGDLLRADGSVLRGDVSYRLAIYQRVHDDRRGSAVPGMKHIEATIDLNEEEIFAFLTRNEKVLLRLEDGRQFPFLVQSSNGNVVAAGAIQDAPGGTE